MRRGCLRDGVSGRRPKPPSRLPNLPMYLLPWGDISPSLSTDQLLTLTGRPGLQGSVASNFNHKAAPAARPTVSWCSVQDRLKQRRCPTLSVSASGPNHCGAQGQAGNRSTSPNPNSTVSEPSRLAPLGRRMCLCVHNRSSCEPCRHLTI